MFLWKLISKDIIRILTYIINKSLFEGIYPDKLKQATIIPIYKKKGDKKLPENYRPITILPNLSKVFEKILLTKLSTYLNDNHIIPNCQYGFRKNHSTKDAILNILLKIEENTKNIKDTCLVMLDLSKAFDKVDHHRLLTKLSNLGFQENFNKIFKSFLSKRSFRIKINNSFSSTHHINTGVPQGSILSPTLFSIYVHDLNQKINSYTVQYADDTTLLIPYVTTEQLQDKLANSYNELNIYLSDHNLTLNVMKTEIILFGKNKTETVTFGTHKIKTSKEVKLLGITITNNLSFDTQINNISKKISSFLPIIYNIRKFLPYNTLKSFYYGFIFSSIYYSCPFILSSSKTSIQKLEIQHKKIIKILFNHNKRDNTEYVYKNTNLISIDKIATLQLQLWSYKIFYELAPQELLNYFKKSTICDHRFTLQHNNQKFSFNNTISKCWNNLDYNSKSITNYQRFKTKMKVLKHN